MYSQWEEEDKAESSEDEGAFLTPDEGLSEVEEGEGEDEAVPKSTANAPVKAENGINGAAGGTARTAPEHGPQPVAANGERGIIADKAENGTQSSLGGTTTGNKPQSAAANAEERADPDTHDVSGTGTSTMHRSIPTSGEAIKVRRRAPTSKSDALHVDQTAVLHGDLDICRTILTLFLTSKMKEAEDMCFDKDPDGNHLYLISAHGIINGMKVCSQNG